MLTLTFLQNSSITLSKLSTLWGCFKHLTRRLLNQSDGIIWTDQGKVSSVLEIAKLTDM